jgi:hypothetical protein
MTGNLTVVASPGAITACPCASRALAVTPIESGQAGARRGSGGVTDIEVIDWSVGSTIGAARIGGAAWAALAQELGRRGFHRALCV